MITYDFDHTYTEYSMQLICRQSRCAALAAMTLELPACIHTGATSAFEPNVVCSVPCSELWLPTTERCSRPEELAALEVVAPGMTAACVAVTDTILATSPAIITVTGMSCHTSANSAYMLQPIPVNGRPHYATSDGGHHLYWTPSSGNAGAPEWLIDTDTKDSHSSANLLSAKDGPPTGSAIWGEWCSAWKNSRLNLSPGIFDGSQCMNSLQQLASTLTETCCRAQDGPTCGIDGTVPRACDVDCAHLWAPYTQRCPAAAQFAGQPELSAFFGDAVGQIVFVSVCISMRACVPVSYS